MHTKVTFLKLSLAALLLAGAPLATQAQKADAANKWATATYKIDGRLDEWASPLPHYNGDTRLFYEFSNDTANLYIAVSTRDELTQYRIINAGLHITINPTGKTKTGPGLTFPIIDQDALYDYRHSPAINYTPTPADKANKQKLLFLHATDITVNGLKDIKDGNISMQNGYGIQAGISNDMTGMLTLEFVIPLSRLVIPPDNTDGVLGINFKINKIDKKEVEKLKAEADKAATTGGGGGGGTPGPGSAYYNYILGYENGFWTRQSLAKKI